MQAQIDTFKEDITKKWDECTALILEKLEVTELRMQNIEMAHIEVSDFQ